jgi:hypothetical protein
MRRIVSGGHTFVLVIGFVVLGLAAQTAPAYGSFGMTCHTDPATGKQICDGVPGGAGGTILIIITVIAIIILVLKLLGGSSGPPPPGAAQFKIKTPPGSGSESSASPTRDVSSAGPRPSPASPSKPEKPASRSRAKARGGE